MDGNFELFTSQHMDHNALEQNTMSSCYPAIEMEFAKQLYLVIHL